jgi:hypothetical protein
VLAGPLQGVLGGVPGGGPRPHLRRLPLLRDEHGVRQPGARLRRPQSAGPYRGDVVVDEDGEPATG